MTAHPLGPVEVVAEITAAACEPLRPPRPKTRTSRLVVAVDQAPGDRLQERRRGSGEQLAERCLSCEHHIDASGLVVERPANPYLVRSLPPAGVRTGGHPDLVEIVDRRHEHPFAQSIEREGLPCRTRPEEEEQHGDECR
jgi:hypothetical protein